MQYTFNPIIQEAEAGGSAWVWTQPGLQIKFQEMHGYAGEAFLKSKNKQKKNFLWEAEDVA